MQIQAMPRMVVFDDRVLESGMRQALANSGFQVIEVGSVEAGLRMLRESCESLTALFWVSLAANTFTGLDQALLLGELQRDTSLAHRHAYLLITPTPVEVRCLLGHLIDRLPVTLLAAPLDRERLLSAMWLATQRIEGSVPLQGSTSAP